MAWGIIMTAVTLVGMLWLVIVSINQQEQGFIRKGAEAPVLAGGRRRLAA